MKFAVILIAASAVGWSQVAVNGIGIVQTGLPAAQDNLLGHATVIGTTTVPPAVPDADPIDNTALCPPGHRL